MDFEEMKVVWDTQNKAPLYAINEAALHTSVRKKARKFKRTVHFFEIILMSTLLGLSVFYLVDEPLFDLGYDRLIALGLFLSITIYFFLGILRRWQQEIAFAPSLLGDVDQALWQVKYHIERSRALRWSYIIPLSLGVTIDFLFPLTPDKPFALFGLFLGMMAFSGWMLEYEIRRWYLPKQQKLEALRETLTAPASPKD